MTAVVGPDGGQLVGTDGARLTIPPGALATPTQVSMTGLGELADPTWVAGEQLEPSNLTLNVPARLELPLQTTVPPEGEAKELGFAVYPDGVYDTGRFPELSTDRTTAILDISDFDGPVIAQNCHAGAGQFVTNLFMSRGCSADDITSRIRQRYPNANLPVNCSWLNPPDMFAMLDTFFDELPQHYDVDAAGNQAPVPDDVIKRLETYAGNGLAVVLAFDVTTFTRGNNGLYTHAAHCAVVERASNGTWQIRNTVIAGGAVLQALGGKGKNQTWWPLDDLNGFRKSHSAEDVEKQTGGALAGYYPPLDRRPVPYGAVRIFVEKSKSDGTPLFTCADAGAPPAPAPSPEAAAPPPPPPAPPPPPPPPPPPTETPPPEPPPACRGPGLQGCMTLPPPSLPTMPPLPAPAPPPQVAAMPKDAGPSEDAAEAEAPEAAAPEDAAPEAAMPEAAVAEAATPDAARAAVADAGAPDATVVDAAAHDAAPACPVYVKSVGFCAGESGCPRDGGACACAPGSEFCCVPGDCYTRDIAACQQERCPPGIGRHYDDTCACDPPRKAVYDPCRPGFMISCQ